MPTVGHILKELDRRRFANGMAALADIADHDRDLVTQALARAPKSARVDVGVLVETLRKEAHERAEAESARRSAEAEPWKYELLLKSPAELVAMRDDLKRRVEAGEGGQPFRPGARTMSHSRAHHVEPDPDPDDDEPSVRRKVLRGIPRRLRPQSALEEPSAATEAPGPASPGTRSSRPQSRQAGPKRRFGVKAFVEYGSLAPEPVDFPNPPWLLPPDDGERDAA
jgi:hypothetical protein